MLIKKSTRQHKKYMALVGDKWVHFGDNRYEQYKDSALGLYSHLNHNDKDRRARWYARHNPFIKKAKSEGKITPSILSAKYLW